MAPLLDHRPTARGALAPALDGTAEDAPPHLAAVRTSHSEHCWTLFRLGRSRLQDDLDGPVLLVLEDLIPVRRLLQWQAMRREEIDAERVVVGQQRQDLIRPAPHVRLPHAQLDLLVEPVAEREVLD